MFENDNFGEWSETEHSTDNETIVPPHVHYTKTARDFIKDIYNFIDDEDTDIVQNSYDNIKKSINKHEFDIDNAKI